MLFTFLLVVHAIIAALLVIVILMQQSEGGGLTSGGGNSGLMSARGAANFLTRLTAVLAGLFILMAIILAVLAATRGSNAIDTSRAQAPVSSPLTGQPQPTIDPRAVPDNGAALVENNIGPDDGIPLQQ